jgi:membrane associated rhomboid family serine protease
MMGLNLTPMVKNLLLVNVGLFLIMLFTGVDLIHILGLRYINADEFQPYQIFTHMFTHAGWGHLLLNMFALFMFGSALENIWGPKRFLAFYLICGFGAALIYSGVIYNDMHKLEVAKDTFFAQPSPENLAAFSNEYLGQVDHQLIAEFERNANDPGYISSLKRDVQAVYHKISNRPMVGASGAVFGILLGFGMLFPNTIIMLLFPPIPMKAKYFVAIFAVIELYAGVHVTPGDNVAHFAHLGGMLFGFLVIKYWQMHRNKFY